MMSVIADEASTAAAGSEMRVVRHELQNTFRLNGFTLKTDASRYLCEQLTPLSGQERTLWTQRLVNAVQSLSLDAAMVDVTAAMSAIQECSQQENDDEEAFEVIDVFDAPQFYYAVDRKKLVQRDAVPLPAARLFASADSKIDVFRHRYEIVRQRVERHEIFSRVAFQMENQQKYRLRRVEELLGSAGRVEQVVVLGLLVQLKTAKFHLEDPTGVVEVDLSTASFHPGLFTENCLVLVEGRYTGDRVLRASAIGQPPIESASNARQYFGNGNFFGGGSKLCAKSSKKMQHLELTNQNASIVFVTEVWLDRKEVLDKLRQMFEGFREIPPVAFIFSGSFCSQPHGDEQYKLIKDGFKQLAILINEFPYLRDRSQFVFVPGALDPAVGEILPRPPLPPSLTSVLRERIASVHFACNPCRLRYCTQEIVVFREDTVEKMCRNCIEMPKAHTDIPKQLCKTLLAQSHLSPLPLHVSPTFWDYDAALCLYPLPDLIVLADSYGTFVESQHDCRVSCTSSFSNNNYTFQVYFPATKDIDDSRIGGE